MVGQYLWEAGDGCNLTTEWSQYIFCKYGGGKGGSMSKYFGLDDQTTELGFETISQFLPMAVNFKNTYKPTKLLVNRLVSKC